MAWQRTALAVSVCALAVLRLRLGSSPVAGIVVASLAVLAATAAFAGARVGYRRMIERLAATRPIGRSARPDSARSLSRRSASPRSSCW
ncbi:MAG: DUF202 domain-containing protein [Actinomycetota bacterium]|nr:DUF202 domain-containing protein [Actinomycetota bacterium]